ncbi:MAG TPA: MBOAT family protein, partial [Vicinamibacterales bacterium]|nr:MBOAT family protein [Vicinamibacterales bacterium]
MNSDQLASVEWPRWAQMWTMALAIYIGCKWLTWQRTPVRNVPVWKRLAYLLAWPGMDAATFLEQKPISSGSHCHSAEWIAAMAKLMVGVALLFGVARMIPPQHAYGVGWIGMIGIVFMLHFGTFHLLSCAWRSVGIQARPLMNRPLASTSLGEFWGRRWNVAFRDLTHRFLFRPCASWFGPRWGTLAGFLFSGAIHEFVISVPARG